MLLVRSHFGTSDWPRTNGWALQVNVSTHSRYIAKVEYLKKEEWVAQRDRMAKDIVS